MSYNYNIQGTIKFPAVGHRFKAQEIVKLHNEIVDALKMTLRKAIRIGELLTEQKQSLKHGEFTPWIKANLPFTDRTAQIYMRLYRERDRFKTETVSGLKEAYRLLKRPESLPKNLMEQTYAKDDDGFTILNRNEFLYAISKIKPGLARNTRIEESEMILFEPERIFSFNDQIAVSYPFKTGLKGGTFAVDFFKLLQKTDGDEIKIKKKGDEVILHSGRIEAGFKLFGDMSPPPLGIEEINRWYVLPKDFVEALDFCLFSASTNISDGILNCLKAEGYDMCSCDNFRVTRYKMASPLAEGTLLLIPQKAVKELLRSKHSPQKVSMAPHHFKKNDLDGLNRSLDEFWLHFLNDEGAVFSCKPMIEEYPPVESIINDVQGEKLELPQDLIKTLLRAEILTDEDEEEVDVALIGISENRLICRSENNHGWIQEEIEVKYNGKKIQIQVNPIWFYQILRSSRKIIIGERHLLFEGDNFKHVMVLLGK